MGRAVGVVVAESTPAMDNKDLWFQPSTGKWFSSETGTWIEQLDIPTEWSEIADKPATFPPDAHSHPTHGDINFTGVVAAAGNIGLTGTRTVGGFKITFNKGLLTGFEPA